MNLNFNERSYLSVIISGFAMSALLLPILLYHDRSGMIVPLSLMLIFIQVLVYFLPRRK